MSVIYHDFDELTEDGSSIPHNVPLSGDYLFYVNGDFDGGKLLLESSINDSDFYTIYFKTVPGRAPVTLSTGEKIRVTLVDSGGAASLFSGVRQ